MSRVLLIEPDQRLGKTYQQALSRQHQVTVAHTAQQAIHSSEDFVPDVIVLDPQIARHNGVEFLYELRSYEDLQNIPVVLLVSMHPEMFSVPIATQRQLGIVQVLYKPQTSLKQLQDTVTKVLHENVS
ncbi:response regulator [Candidatus Saccharibacteria bacterium]|nr:response regulator [Candidatus Saccharibacteria bacterium]